MKKYLAVAVILLFIGVAIAPSINANINRKSEIKPLRKNFLISFPSNLEIEMDEYEGRLPIHQSVTIHFTVQYWVDIPDVLLRSPFRWLKNWFLFGNIITPLQTINFSLLDVPEWCHPYISYPDLRIEVDNTPQVIMNNLIIMVEIEAPAEPFTFTLRAEASKLKRVEAIKCDYQVTLTPDFIPAIQISTENPFVYAPPNQYTSIPIALKNLGNALTKVTSRIVTDLEGWVTYITPEIFIPVNYTLNVTFACIPPDDFYGNQTIELKFEVSHWLWTDAPTLSVGYLITAYYPYPPLTCRESAYFR